MSSTAIPISGKDTTPWFYCLPVAILFWLGVILLIGRFISRAAPQEKIAAGRSIEILRYLTAFTRTYRTGN